jgi:small GTP-binding protein
MNQEENALEEQHQQLLDAKSPLAAALMVKNVFKDTEDPQVEEIENNDKPPSSSSLPSSPSSNDGGDDDDDDDENGNEENSSEKSDATDDNRLTLEQIRANLAKLEIPPSREEIEEMMAQYDSEGSNDYSDESYESDDDDDDSLHQETCIMKVLVVGNARCGKTSTIRRYTSKSFSEEYVSTIGADFVEKDYDFNQNLKLNLQLWDIAGQDRFAKLTRAYFREAKGAVIVCDITRENTIEAVTSWKNEIDNCCKDLNNGTSIPVVLIANKSDLLLNPMGALDIGVNMQKCVERNGILEWFRASAKNGDYVDEAFQFLIEKMVHNLEANERNSSSGFNSENEQDDSSSSSPRRDKDIIRLDEAFPLSSIGGQQPKRLVNSTNNGCDCN